jgi:dephospho-CoA kinase
MKVVGITGGIGSGKSTVAKVFESLGIPLYKADDRAKALYRKKEVRALVIDAFGEEVYSGEELNKELLARLVFGNEAYLNTLNAIIHPAVREDFDDWVRKQKAPYVLKEAAILIESGSYKHCNAIILVVAPEEIRIERVMQRDGSTREEVEARINKQWSDDRKRPYAQYEIQNGGKTSIIKQVLEIHRQLVKGA